MTDTHDLSPELLTLEPWVRALEDIRAGDKGYWGGISHLARSNDNTKATYPKGKFEDESEKIPLNLVKEKYKNDWANIRDDFAQHTRNETDPNTQKEITYNLAEEIEAAIHFSTEIMMMPTSPFVNAMYTWMMLSEHANSPDNENPLKPDFYFQTDKKGKVETDNDGNPIIMHQYGIRAKLLEGLGQAVLKESQRLELANPTSWGYKECEKDGVAKPKYQVKYKDGSWQDLEADDLEKMLQHEKGPHVVMTANHAFLEDRTADLDSITSGVEELMRSSVDETRAKVQEAIFPAMILVDEAKDAKRKKAYNLAELEFRRDMAIEYAREKIAEYGAVIIDNQGIEVPAEKFNPALHKVKEPNSPNLNAKGFDEKPGEHHTVMVAAVYSRENNVLNLAHLFRRLDKINHHKDRSEEDPLLDVSPASLMIASTILKTILEDPSLVKSATDEPAFLLVGENGEGRTEQPELLKTGEHIFRKDAAERARHLVQVGFSQGGNVMRDALRYVVHEIDRVGVKSPNKQKSDKDAARDIMSALSVTAISLNEIAMNDYYTEHGVNCGIISNAQERPDNEGFIAPPPAHQHSTTDPVITIDAFKGHHGHHPGKMFAAIVAKGGHALSHFQCAFAPNVGNIALRYIRPTEEGLVLEISGRSKEENISEVFGHLQQALLEAGIENASLDRVDRTDSGRRQYILKSEGMQNPETLMKLQQAVGKALGTLVQEGQTKKGAAVSYDIDTGLDAMKEIAGKVSGLINIDALKDYVDETVIADRVLSNWGHSLDDAKKIANRELKDIEPKSMVMVDELSRIPTRLDTPTRGPH